MERAPVSNRILAKGIDFAIVFFIGLIMPRFLGPILGFLYILLADGFQFKGFRGQSVGKKALGLQVISLIRTQPADFRDSAIRNAPIAIPLFFAIIPVWGWVLSIPLGLLLIPAEIYLMIKVRTRYRLGDVMADTEVIQLDKNIALDFKELAQTLKKRLEEEDRRREKMKSE